MRYKIFTVYDSKAEAYLQPFFSPAVGLAVRSFSDAVNTKDHQFSKHAADYTLFEIGAYDDVTCTITMLPAKVSLGSANEFLNSEILR